MRLGAIDLQAVVAVGRRLGRDYWLFWSGQTVSDLGSALTAFALPLLTYRLTGSAINLALTTAATFLPSLLIGLPAGAWADRMDRRRLMIGAELGSACAVALLPVAFWTGTLSVWLIYAVAFIRATCGLFFGAAHFAAVPSLVAKDDLVRANGYLRAGGSAASIVGPPLGGALLLLVPIQLLILGDAASFAVSAATIWAMRARLRVDDPNAPARGSLRADIAEGLTYVRSHRVLPALLALLFLVNLLATGVGAELVLFAKQELGARDAELGLFYSAAGIGAIAMGLLSPLVRARWSLSRLTIVPLVLHGLLITAFAFAPNVPVAVVLWGALMMQISLFNIVFTSVWQQLVPTTLLGRVSSVVGLVAFAGIPIGSIGLGAVIEGVGSPMPIFAGVGIAVALVSAAFARSPIREIDHMAAAWR